MDDPLGVSFTVSGLYTNVSIAAYLSSASGSPGANDGAGTVYLTNSIGPGTTIANQIAATTLFSIAFAPSTETSLFSGLTLESGTYYLIASSNLGAGGLGFNHYNGNSSTGSVGPDLVRNPSYTEDAYPPATVFINCSGFDFDVTGTAVRSIPTSATPEPSSLALLGTGVIGIAGVLRRRIAR